MLGSSVLGSSVLGSSVLGTTTIVEAYSGAIPAAQIALSLASIGLLISLQLTDPSFEHTTKALLELRRSWLPVSALLVILFCIIAVLKIWSVLAV